MTYQPHPYQSPTQPFSHQAGRGQPPHRLPPASYPPQQAPPYEPAPGAFAPQPGQRPAPDATAVFANIGGAQATKQANWIRPGDYLMRIEAMRLITSQKQERILIDELTCLHVFSDALAVAVGIPPHVPGETLAASYNDKHWSFLGNVKAMVAGLEGVPPDQIDQALASEGSSITAHCVRMTSPEQPYAGMLVHVVARQILTRRQTPFTAVDWKREVRPSELPGIMPPQELQRLFPGDALQRLIESEQRIHGAAPAQQQVPPQQNPPQQAAPPAAAPQQNWPGSPPPSTGGYPSQQPPPGYSTPSYSR